MGSFALKAEVRSDTGKEKAKKLRKQGKFPAIVYGGEKEPASLTLDIRDTEVVLGRIHGEKVLVDLSYGDTSEKVFVRNIQRDPALEKLLHVDFYRVDLNRELDTKTPVHPVGLPKGVKMGGLLEHGLRELAIRCLPTKVPPHIEVNVEELEIGHSIHVGDLPEMDGVRVLSPEDSVLFSVAAKAKEVEELPAAEEEEAAEEAAGEKKEAEEDAASPAG